MLDELVAKSRAEAADPRWLGSEEQRALLEDALASVFALPGWKVTWLPSGTHSYSEAATKTIAIERVTSGDAALPDDDVAEYVALTLGHEALHARHSGSSGNYAGRRAAQPPALRPSVDNLYHRIEDARVQRLAMNADASLGPHLLKFHDEGAWAAREAISRQVWRGSVDVDAGFTAESAVSGDRAAAVPSRRAADAGSRGLGRAGEVRGDDRASMDRYD